MSNVFDVIALFNVESKIDLSAEINQSPPSHFNPQPWHGSRWASNHGKGQQHPPHG